MLLDPRATALALLDEDLRFSELGLFVGMAAGAQIPFFIGRDSGAR